MKLCLLECLWDPVRLPKLYTLGCPKTVQNHVPSAWRQSTHSGPLGDDGAREGSPTSGPWSPTRPHIPDANASESPHPETTTWTPVQRLSAPTSSYTATPPLESFGWKRQQDWEREARVQEADPILRANRRKRPRSGFDRLSMLVRLSLENLPGGCVGVKANFLSRPRRSLPIAAYISSRFTNPRTP